MSDSVPNGRAPATEPTPREALERLVENEPRRHDLFFGFVGAIGTPWDQVLGAFSESLRRFDYDAEEIHIASLIDDLDYKPWGKLPNRDSQDYYEARMDACDLLRQKVQNAGCMAALVVMSISEERTASQRITAQGSEPTGRPKAYLLRSLKHPDEVGLLRHVYRDAFSLVGVACGANERRQVLSDRLSLFQDSRALAELLITRDESDQDNQNYGQNVRDTYAMADVFVPSGRGVDCQHHVARYIDAVFGEPFLTPTPDEEGMRFAQDAALRSAAAGRQVGAALIPTVGTPVVAGTNEVPKPGGGQYWTGDFPDYRDYKTGEDPNPIYKRRVIQELLERLAHRGWLVEELTHLSGEELVARASEPDASGNSILAGIRASALIEFTRCLHAEQSAIVNAARSGVSTQGATLYTSTFPCHECAKMIVGSGITEVHYIEPYPKSLVDRLYRDMIETSPSLDTGRGLVDNKVPFHQFLGIAPRKYSQAFTAGARRLGHSLIEFDRRSACPRTYGWSALGFEELEATTAASISRIIDDLAATEEEETTSDDSIETLTPLDTLTSETLTSSSSHQHSSEQAG